MQIEKHQEETRMRIEKHQEETKQQIDETKKQESPRKRRPESEGLKQLKNQTEDKLETCRRLEFIPTKQAEEAKKLLEGKRSIVIKGNPGEGKTTVAFHLINNEMYRDRRVVLYCPQDWKAVDMDWVAIVVLENIFGQFDLDPVRLQEWMLYLPTIQEQVDAGKLWVIVTTRVDILSKACSKLGSVKLFLVDLSLTLSSEQLTNSEKMSILNRELHRHKKSMKEDDKEKCISNFTGLIGFPQCCSLFASDSKLFDRGPEFFGFPKKFFVEAITSLEATSFLPLAFLFCNGEICEENLSPETMPETSKHLLMELASHLRISEKEASITLLSNDYDHFLELYVVKSMSYNLESGVHKPCIWFTHATVCEAVGQVLAYCCIEMVVKYGDSEFLYQRTYTAKAKDDTAENVFIPSFLYGLLARRMVHDVVKRGLVESVVKHSALKQENFVRTLKYELHKGNEIEDFFIPGYYFMSESDLSDGKCTTFMQYLLQSDEDVVRLVYDDFLEFLACAHNNNSECWQCGEKQKLLELALYYHHFQIADILIAMKACYTHVSLCNAARCGDLKRVQTILETLKRSRVFNPGCKGARNALCRAYISGNQSLIKFLLKEGIILDSWHVVDAVQHGDIEVLMKVVEHLKCHNKWDPHTIDDVRYDGSRYFQALSITYDNEKFDMADYLLKNEVKVSMDMLVYVSKNSSQQAVARVIQNLKDTGNWDPKCHDASQALENAYSLNKYDVCGLLVQEGVSMTMKHFFGVTGKFQVSLKTVNKAIQHLKDTDNWDPKCDDASQALENAYALNKYDVCGLLVDEGVSMTMKNLVGVTGKFQVSLKTVNKAIQHLKDTDNWDPKCDDASQALENAYALNNYDVCDLLVQKGVSMTMKNLPGVTAKFLVSLETVKKAIQHLKDTDNWDPKCDDASQALENAYALNKYDVCGLLVDEGVSMTMKNLVGVTGKFQVSLKTVNKAIQHLKDTDNWDPKCDDASQALENAYALNNYDVCDLLVQKGVSMTMKNLPGVTGKFLVSLETVKKAIQHLKDTDNWDPKCDDASRSLGNAYKKKKYDVCDVLAQEGVSLTMKNLPGVTGKFQDEASQPGEEGQSGTEGDMESQGQAGKGTEDDKAPDVQVRDEWKQPVIEETYTWIEQGIVDKRQPSVEPPSVQVAEDSENDKQVETPERSESIRSMQIGNEDVQMSSEDLEQFEHLQKALEAGADDNHAVNIVDTIREKGSEVLKTQVLRRLARHLKQQMASIEKQAKFRIWPGTDISTGETKFVCLHKGQLDTKLERFYNIVISYHNIDKVTQSDDMKGQEDLELTEKDALLIESAIEEHGDRLFSQHSNLQMVCGGPFLLHEIKGTVEESTAIILYCLPKGIKPYGEEEFPSEITFKGKKIPVDIREGYFALTHGARWYSSLCMGISIGEKGQKDSGTIGPFVNLDGNNRGFITCAHVVGTEGTYVVQPSHRDVEGKRTAEKLEEHICGRVQKYVRSSSFSIIENGFTKIVGMDAALVKLNERRNIVPRGFPHIPDKILEAVAIDQESSLQCTTDSSCPVRSKVLKCGRTTDVTLGEVVSKGSMVKPLELEMDYDDMSFIMKGIELIEGISPIRKFAEKGDSGAGVFRIDEKNILTLTGLLVGAIESKNDDRCAMIPIKYVLSSLGVTLDQLTFG